MSKRKTRRAKGEGTIFQRKDGRWQGAHTLGSDENDKQIRKTVYGKTRAEVVAKLDELKRRMMVGVVADAPDLRAYMDRWLAEKAAHVKPRTIDSYRYNAEKYLLPRLGRIPLDRLTPIRIQDALNDIATRSGVRTSNLCRTVLGAALKQALRWRLLTYNPVEGTTPAKQEKAEMPLWTPVEVRHFLKVTSRHRLHAFFYLAIASGLRCGELLGLKWSDLDGNVLTVRRTLDTRSGTPTYSTPKTANSIRRVTLGDDAVAVLETHRTRQEEECARLGSAWPDTGHVFVSEVGTLLHASNVTQTSHRLQAKARRVLRRKVRKALKAGRTPRSLAKLDPDSLLPRLKLHGFRHLNVSIRRRMGQDAKLIADQVGHADPAFTTKLYTHLFDEERTAAAISLRDHVAPKVTRRGASGAR